MTRIVFNGQEYPSREAMPEDVRQAYDEALAMVRGAYPGAVDLSADHTVVNVERKTTIKFDGAESLPEPVRRVVESVLGAAIGGTTDRLTSETPDPLQRTTGMLETTMGVMLAFGAGFAFVFGIVVMVGIGGGRSHLLERLIVAVATLLFLGWLDTMATRLARRRQPLLAPDTPGYRRFVVWSSAGLATAAVLLLGVAWYLP
jgi:hypothetical protein